MGGAIHYISVCAISQAIYLLFLHTASIFSVVEVRQMKANGMTNKQIYTELGISKALFYLRMKEYKQ